MFCYIFFLLFQMRDLTARLSFLIRKKLDNFLYWVFPRKWVPLYTSVTFTRMRYHHCISNKKWQDEVKKIQSAYNNDLPNSHYMCKGIFSNYVLVFVLLWYFSRFLKLFIYYLYCQNPLHFQHQKNRKMR